MRRNGQLPRRNGLGRLVKRPCIHIGQQGITGRHEQRKGRPGMQREVNQRGPRGEFPQGSMAEPLTQLPLTGDHGSDVAVALDMRQR